MRSVLGCAVVTIASWIAASAAAAEGQAIFSFVSQPERGWEIAEDIKRNPVLAQKQIFKGVATADAPLPGVNDSKVQGVLKDESLGDVLFASLNLNRLLNARSGDSVLVLADKGSLKLEVTNLLDKSDDGGRHHLTANVGPDGSGFLALLTDGGGVSGTIQYDDRAYQVRHLDGKWHALVETNESASGRDYGNDVVERDGDPGKVLNDKTQSGGQINCSSNSSDDAVIDVVVVYTPMAKSMAVRDIVDVEEHIDIATDIGNTAFKQSEVRAQFNLLERMEVAYAEKADYLDDLDALRSGVGGLKAAVEKRKALKADVLVLVVHNDNPTECGLADGIGVNKSNALAVVNWKCLITKFSYAHEIGHLAGGRHDNDEDGPEIAHGFISTDPVNTFGTIMATQSGCVRSACGRIRNWSNPNVIHKGRPTGTHDKHNNACVWNSNARRLSGFDGG